MSISASVISTLAVGIPSAGFAAATYLLAARARRDTEGAARRKVDADAYARARDLYESSVAELRKGQGDLRDEVGRLHAELDESRERIRVLRHELAAAQAEIWNLKHPGPLPG